MFKFFPPNDQSEGRGPKGFLTMLKKMQNWLNGAFIVLKLPFLSGVAHWVLTACFVAVIVIAIPIHQ